MLLCRELPTRQSLSLATVLKHGVERRKYKKVDSMIHTPYSYGQVDGNYADTYLPVAVILPQWLRDDCKSGNTIHISCNDCNFDSVICCADLVQSFLQSVDAVQRVGLRAQGKGFLIGQK